MSRSSIAAARAASLEMKSMSGYINRTDANLMKVVVEQLQAECVNLAKEWAALDRGEKIRHWIEWQEASDIERRFHRFDQVLQVVQEAV